MGNYASSLKVVSRCFNNIISVVHFFHDIKNNIMIIVHSRINLLFTEYDVNMFRPYTVLPLFTSVTYSAWQGAIS